LKQGIRPARIAPPSCGKLRFFSRLQGGTRASSGEKRATERKAGLICRRERACGVRAPSLRDSPGDTPERGADDRAGGSWVRMNRASGASPRRPTGILSPTRLADKNPGGCIGNPGGPFSAACRGRTGKEFELWGWSRRKRTFRQPAAHDDALCPEDKKTKFDFQRPPPRFVFYFPGSRGGGDPSPRHPAPFPPFSPSTRPDTGSHSTWQVMEPLQPLSCRMTLPRFIPNRRRPTQQAQGVGGCGAEPANQHGSAPRPPSVVM